MARLLDGKAMAAQITAELGERVAKLKQETGVTPTLAIIQVGDLEGSGFYVKRKAEACALLGMQALVERLPESAALEQVLQAIYRFNADRNVHGVMVQLPLPRHLSEEEVVSAISPEKDVDGLNPASLGCLLAGRRCFASAGAEAAYEMIERGGYSLEGRHVAVLGASSILGKPFAALALNKGASVTICPKDASIEEYAKYADILLVDIGRPRAVRKEMVKQGCVVVDAGNNHVEGRIVGDVDFEGVRDVASAISPVPGGLGPMLIAALMRNLLTAAIGQSGAT